jgi:hypothetical protein
MTVPAIIDRVLSTVNREDTEAFLDLFSDDGEVDDWGSVYRGRAAIRVWSDRELIGARARFMLKSTEEHGETISMIVQVGGEGFNGPSRFTFTMAGGQIRRMRITAH